MATNPTASPPDRCPLCQQPNDCAMEQARHSGQPQPSCWCMQATFSAELLARVPAQARRQACICAACARSAASAPAKA